MRASCFFGGAGSAKNKREQDPLPFQAISEECVGLLFVSLREPASEFQIPMNPTWGKSLAGAKKKHGLAN